MSGLLGLSKNKTLDGLTTGYFDNSYIINETVENETINQNLNSTSINNSGDIYSSTYNSISSSYISNLPTYETNTDITLNSLQSQISNITSTSTSGGGYFIVELESNNISTANTNGYSWSSGSGQRFANLFGTVPSCNLVSASIYLSGNVTTNTFIGVIKNGINSLTLTIPINTAFIKVSSLNLSFSFGDTIQIRTTSGTTAVAGRISLIFSTNGIKGADGISPNLLIGTVTTLSYGNSATASFTGTQANPILNLGLVNGPTGPTGPIGPIGPSGINGTNGINGIDGTNGINGINGINGTNGTNGIDGISPVLTIGTVTTLDYGNSSTATISGTQSDPILNLGLVIGPKGDKGDTGDKGDSGDQGEKGEKGDKGKDADTIAIAALTTTAVGAASAAGISATASATSATASATSSTASGISATAARDAADEINAKLIFFTADAINVKEVCKAKLTVNDGIADRIILNPHGTSEFSYACQFDNAISVNNINNNNNVLNISSASYLNLSSQTIINIDAPTINIGNANMSNTIYLNGTVINSLENWFDQFTTTNGFTTQVGI
jgi:hypothetical protein